jgi:branched-chain amino acid transport system permease protein
MLIAQLIVAGFAQGAVYAALALAIVVVHRSTGLVNFAQGEFATLSAMLTAALTAAGLNVWLALLIAVIVSAVGAALIQRLLVRRVMARSNLVSLTVLIGLYVCANAVSQIVFGVDPRPLTPLFPAGQFEIAGVRISWSLVGVVLLQALVISALTFFFSRTKAGLAFRAVASAPQASRIAGLPVERVHMIGWALAAAIGAIASVSLTNLGVYVQPSMMQPVLVFSLGAVTIGGFDSAVGAIVGGVLLGIAASLITTLVPGVSGQAGIVVSFLVIVVVLLVRPQGLFGRKRVARV